MLNGRLVENINFLQTHKYLHFDYDVWGWQLSDYGFYQYHLMIRNPMNYTGEFKVFLLSFYLLVVVILPIFL